MPEHLISPKSFEIVQSTIERRVGMKNKLMWFYYCWNSVMNLKYNPIGYVRDTSVQMYLMIVLSVLWTCTFCGLIAGWMNAIPLVYGHIAFIFSAFLTYSIFEDAARDGREWFLKWDREYTLSKAFRNKDKTKNACKWDLEIEA